MRNSPRQVSSAPPVMVQRLGVFQVADVLAQEGVTPPPGGKAGLLLRPEGHHPVGGPVQQHRLGDPAPAAAQEVGRPLPDHRHRVVAPVADRPVVEQIAVGHAGQRGEGFVVVNEHRAARPVGAGEHHRRRAAGGAVGQQPVQRCVGQQDAQSVGGAQLPPGVRVELFQQQDGPAGALEQRGGRPVDAAEAPRFPQIPAEQGQRLVRPVLAPPQPPDGRGAAPVAGQVDAPRPLDRQDAPRRQGALGQGDRVAVHRAAGGVQVEGPGPADRAGVGLGVVPAGGDVAVFGRTGRAHGKAGHGGVGPVVGQRLQDGEPGPAVGAVDEGVAVAAVGGVVHLPQAGRAGGQVGGHQGGASPAGAGADDEPPVPCRGGQQLGLHRLHHRQRRRVPAHRRQEGVQPGGVALQLPFHPGGGVAHPARQGEAAGQPVEEGPEPHPLHDAADPEAPALGPPHASAARTCPAR